MVEKAGEIPKADFPGLAETICPHLPEEKTKRMG